MDFKSLGRRDIFGILLPGMTPVLISAYALYAALAPFQLPVTSILEQEFLVTVLLFASAYLIGSLLRLFAADRVDERSGRHLLKAWQKEYKGRVTKDYESEFRKKLLGFLNGDDVPEISIGFDDWLWLADKFPYIAWQNRFWRSHGFQEVLDFFQKNHKTKMWPQSQVSPKSFYNYCKLAIIDGGGTLAEEVNTAEGTTRFFAGTFTGMRLSIWLLLASFLVQVLVIIGLALAQRVGSRITLGLDWTAQSIHLVLSLGLIFALLWMCRQIVAQFRIIRQKEAETVFHAFYLYATRPYRQEEEKKKAA
jgi:hypothetical protein